MKLIATDHLGVQIFSNKWNTENKLEKNGIFQYDDTLWIVKEITSIENHYIIAYIEEYKPLVIDEQ